MGLWRGKSSQSGLRMRWREWKEDFASNSGSVGDVAIVGDGEKSGASGASTNFFHLFRFFTEIHLEFKYYTHVSAVMQNYCLILELLTTREHS